MNRIKPISKTVMIQATRETANKLCLRERSSGVWLEEELKMDLLLVNHKLEKLDANKQRKLIHAEAVEKKCFLPALGKFIRVREQEARSLRSKMIIQLMCIVLLRIKYRMHSAALVVLLYIGNILERMKGYEYSMRRLVYTLIGRVSAKLNRSAPMKQVTRRRNVRSLTNACCPLQYNIFREKFQARLRKSELIEERTFEDLLQQVDNTKEASQVRLPEEIHPDMESYKEITVNIDKKSLTFSYEYPKLLENRVPLKDYRFFISKLNKIIAPEAVCYNTNSILRLFYIPILILLAALMGTSAIFLADLESQWSWSVAAVVLLCLSLTLIVSLSIYIYADEEFYKNPLPIHKELGKVIDSMSKRFWCTKTVFRVGDSIESFSIFISTGRDDQSQPSSSDSSSSSDSDTPIDQGVRHHCSLKKFFQETRRSTVIKRSSQRVSIDGAPKLGGIDTIQEQDEHRTNPQDTPGPVIDRMLLGNVREKNQGHLRKREQIGAELLQEMGQRQHNQHGNTFQGEFREGSIIDFPRTPYSIECKGHESFSDKLFEFLN